MNAVDDKCLRIQILLFCLEDFLLSELMSFYLFCLGPDCVTLNQCDSSDLNPTYQQQSFALAVDSKLPAQDMEPASLAAMRVSDFIVV